MLVQKKYILLSTAFIAVLAIILYFNLIVLVDTDIKITICDPDRICGRPEKAYA